MVPNTGSAFLSNLLTYRPQADFQPFGWTGNVLDAQKIVHLMAAIDLHPDIKSVISP